MAEDMSVFINDVSDIVAEVNSIIVTRAKLQGHNPNLFLNLASKGIKHMSEIGDFSEYTPRFIDVLRQMSEEELGDFILGNHRILNEYNDFPEKMQKSIICETLNKEPKEIFKK